MAFQHARRVFVAGLAALAMAHGVMANPATSDITGHYIAEGRNPDGSAYVGTVQIAEVGGKVSISWTVGAQSYRGIGARDGRVLVIDWGADDPVIYVIMPDGSLHGTWAHGKALERLLPN